jgi:hypothetical protein
MPFLFFSSLAANTSKPSTIDPDTSPTLVPFRASCSIYYTILNQSWNDSSATTIIGGLII